MIKKNTQVMIYQVVLSANERPKNIPNDTKLVPFELRIKGRLIKDAEIGDVVEIKTMTHRIESGILIQEKPYYQHNFGHFVDIIDDIKQIILDESEGL